MVKQQQWLPRRTMQHHARLQTESQPQAGNHVSARKADNHIQLPWPRAALAVLRVERKRNGSSGCIKARTVASHNTLHTTQLQHLQPKAHE